MKEALSFVTMYLDTWSDRLFGAGGRGGILPKEMRRRTSPPYLEYCCLPSCSSTARGRRKRLASFGCCPVSLKFSPF